MKKYTNIICMVAAVCLLGAAAFCGFRIYSHYAHESEQEEVFEKIAEVVKQAQTGESETADVLLTEKETVLAEYCELYLQNTDMVGWLSIADTNINYDRFKKNIDRVGGEGTAEFVREAISIYCDK